MKHIIYPCDLTIDGSCPNDKWGCGHNCEKCRPHIIEDEEIEDDEEEA